MIQDSADLVDVLRRGFRHIVPDEAQTTEPHTERRPMSILEQFPTVAAVFDVDTVEGKRFRVEVWEVK